MTNSKALQALALLEQPPPDIPGKPPFSLSVRLPGDLADRVIALHDYGPTDHSAKPSRGEVSATPSKPFISRNAVIVALIEAGLEAVEAAAQTTTIKGKKHA